MKESIESKVAKIISSMKLDEATGVVVVDQEKIDNELLYANHDKETVTAIFNERDEILAATQRALADVAHDYLKERKDDETAVATAEVKVYGNDKISLEQRAVKNGVAMKKPYTTYGASTMRYIASGSKNKGELKKARTDITNKYRNLFE